MQPTLYVAGDVHLRNDSSPFLGFLDLLASRAPSHLVILGDLFDYWLETERTIAQFQTVFDKFQTLRLAGWRLDFVLGNRELSSGSRLRLACGVKTHWPDFTLRIADKQIRIVHGDRLCHDPTYHLMAAFHVSMPAPVHHGLAHLGRKLSKGSSNKPSAKRRLKKVFIDPRRVAAHRSKCNLLIAGHIHQVIHQKLRGVELMVVGDWAEQRGHWIEINCDGHAQMCQAAFPSS